MPFMFRGPPGKAGAHTHIGMHVIRYRIRGNGPVDVLLLAPGGMNSTLDKWTDHPYDPWTALNGDEFRIIAMDQRNSTDRCAGPLGTGWETYRDDQLALFDRLGSSRCLLVGSCIGTSFALALMKHSPDRFPAAVLLQPIGLAQHTTEPGEKWEGMNGGTRKSFVKWSEDMLAKGRFAKPDMDELHERMYGSGRDFVFSVTREDVESMDQPMLVFMGRDRSHPSEIARDVARLARNTTLVEKWRDEDQTAGTDRRIEAFLVENGAA